MLYVELLENRAIDYLLHEVHGARVRDQLKQPRVLVQHVEEAGTSVVLPARAAVCPSFRRYPRPPRPPAVSPDSVARS